MARATKIASVSRYLFSLLERRFQVNGGYWLAPADFYADYKRWCSEIRVHPFDFASQRQFAQALIQLGVRRRHVRAGNQYFVPSVLPLLTPLYKRLHNAEPPQEFVSLVDEIWREVEMELLFFETATTGGGTVRCRPAKREAADRFDQFAAFVLEQTAGPCNPIERALGNLVRRFLEREEPQGAAAS